MVVAAKSERWNNVRALEMVDLTFHASDFMLAGMTEYFAASGALLVELAGRLDVQRQERDDILFQIAELSALFSPEAGERWRKLQKLLCKLAEITARISRLSQVFKAVKRELRRRQHDLERGIYCGVDFRKRTWFLLHGSHPPRFKRVFAIAFIGEMI